MLTVVCLLVILIAAFVVLAGIWVTGNRRRLDLAHWVFAAGCLMMFAGFLAALAIFPNGWASGFWTVSAVVVLGLAALLMVVPSPPKAKS